MGIYYPVVRTIHILVESFALSMIVHLLHFPLYSPMVCVYALSLVAIYVRISSLWSILNVFNVGTNKYDILNGIMTWFFSFLLLYDYIIYIQHICLEECDAIGGT